MNRQKNTKRDKKKTQEWLYAPKKLSELFYFSFLRHKRVKWEIFVAFLLCNSYSAFAYKAECAWYTTWFLNASLQPERDFYFTCLFSFSLFFSLSSHCFPPSSPLFAKGVNLISRACVVFIRIAVFWNVIRVPRRNRNLYKKGWLRSPFASCYLASAWLLLSWKVGEWYFRKRRKERRERKVNRRDVNHFIQS